MKGGGERHYGLPQQRRGNHRLSKEEQALPHREGRKDTKGGRTQREEM